MKKRLLSLALILCLIVTLLSLQVHAADTNLSPAELYTEYLVNGGYNAIMDRKIDKEDVGIESVLIDLDDDNIQEALVWVSDLSTMGVRGCMTTCAVLDVENGKVVIRLSAFTGGGSMGGDFLNVKYDTQLDQYVVVFSSVIRDGIDGGGSLYRLYDNHYQISKEMASYYYAEDAVSYQDKIAKIKSETSFYQTENGYFYYWQIDGRYVSEAEYDALYDRYTYPEKDSPYVMYEGTYDKPIKIKTVPEGYEFDEDSFGFSNYTLSKISKKYFTTMYGRDTGKLLYKTYKDLGASGVCFGMSYVTAAIWNQLPAIDQFVNEKLIGSDSTCESVRDLKKDSKISVAGDKISLADYIKYAHIYQLSSAANQERLANLGQHDAMVDAIRQYLEEDQLGITIEMSTFELDEDGNPVEDENGDSKISCHQVLAVGIEGNDILIDDPNTTGDFERLTYNGVEDWSYSAGNVSSENTIMSYQTDIDMPYLILLTGNAVNSDLADDDNEEHTVQGMTTVDGKRVLLSVDYDEYTVEQNSVIPVIMKGGIGAPESNLFWVKKGNSATVTDLSGADGMVYLAGNGGILSVGGCDTDSVTMTVSDTYTGLLLKSEAGENCTLSLETVTDEGEDLVITVEGTADRDSVTFAKTDSGISYTGLDDVTVTLTKGEDSEISRTVADNDSTTVLVDYDRAGIVFEIQLNSSDLPTNPFVDVKQGKYYYDHVLWAVDQNITTGITETTFQPDSTCTRAQVVTFLWRAAGSPEPESTVNPFNDVKQTQFHYKAVLWAVENGITNGMTADTFGSKESCTRGQVATFLWRTLNKPEATGQEHPFTDLVEGRFYYDAVLWAVENGITTGMTSTTFAPEDSCTRGQIVTFLHRALG